MLTKFEEITKIIEKAYEAELPVDFNYESIKKWMTDVTNNCKNEIKEKFPEVPIRFSLYQQDAYEQFIASLSLFLTMALISLFLFILGIQTRTKAHLSSRK